MIRRRMGDAFWLLRQQDCAALSATLASAFGNRQFAGPSSDAVIRAAARHDDGWAIPDDALEPDPAGLPAHFAQASRPTQHAAWIGSADAAAATGDYEGLLVALHGLALSAVAAGQMPADRFDDEQRRRQFDLNKVQHALIERIEHLRGRLGYAVDRPLRLGLADGWTTPAEDALRLDLRLLRACDALALHALCDLASDAPAVQPLARPGGQPVSLALTHEPGVLRVRPWPFTSERVTGQVACRPVQALAYADAAALRAAYEAAPRRTLAVAFGPG